MANGIRTGDSRGFNKGRSSKFSKVPEFDKPEEGRKTYRPKRCGNNNKDEDNSHAVGSKCAGQNQWCGRWYEHRSRDFPDQ